MISLQPYSTFRIKAQAQDLFTMSSKEDIIEFVKSWKLNNYNDHLIIGWWSNIVFTHDFDGVIISNKLLWQDTIKETDTYIILKIQSGEGLDTFVQRSIDNHLSGIENLIMIPGTMGASPVQNVGAYGVEMRDLIVNVEGVDLNTGETRIYTNEECEFWYRDSIFKHTLKQWFFITSVTLRLTKVDANYNPSTHYADIDTMLLVQWRDGIKKLHPQDIAKAISTLRTSKLPDRKKIGTVGSFFKNPLVSKDIYNELQKEFPDLTWYVQWNNMIKLSAGQLIEECELKWYREGNIGTYDHHALVLVNYGADTTWEELKNFIKLIQNKVLEKFWIELIPEVNVF